MISFFLCVFITTRASFPKLIFDVRNVLNELHTLFLFNYLTDLFKNIMLL